jgi:general secretion pathway protein G
MMAVTILAIIVTIAIPVVEDYRERAKLTQAKIDIQAIDSAILRYRLVTTQYPDSLSDIGVAYSDPWDRPYQYLNIETAKGKGKLRKDHNLVPINSDYDLYSMGPDGKTASPLTAKISRDDIIRANNGDFVGVASEY